MPAFAGLLACALIAPAKADVERPPQFVVMAFDNCTELDRWQELTDFAAQMNRDGDRLHFTFFVSGINYIADASRNIYEAPHQRRGVSRINFGGSPQDIRRRVDYVNGLYRAGHEIASHAIGHFNGKSWSTSDWDKEFRAYGDIVRSNGFRYDTSGDSAADEWPAKIDGIWRFNLARVKLQGSGKNLLSMDYNFFVAQGRVAGDPRRIDAAREQMLATYLHYFKTNYAGNRAPLHIGHHFFAFHNGAYNEALKSFARTVCGLPEVRCVSYARLADFMDRQNPETLAAYRKGDFARAATPLLSVAGLAR